jgi:hypothetical protein
MLENLAQFAISGDEATTHTVFFSKRFVFNFLTDLKNSSYFQSRVATSHVKSVE